MNRGCAMVSFCIISLLVLRGFRIGSVQSEQQHDIRLSAADELCNGAPTVDRNHRYSWNITDVCCMPFLGLVPKEKDEYLGLVPKGNGYYLGLVPGISSDELGHVPGIQGRGHSAHGMCKWELVRKFRPAYDKQGVFVACATILACGVLRALQNRYNRRWRFLPSTRVAKRRRARTRCFYKMQFRTIIFMTHLVFGHCMEQQSTVLSRISELAQASQVTAQTAVTVLQKLEERSGGSGMSEAKSGLDLATRVLQKPPSFSGEDPSGFNLWRHQFMSWLSFADARYVELLNHVETSAETPHLVDATEEVKDLGIKLHGILTSYLRGAPLHLTRVNTHERNGFQVWKQLCEQFMPASKQRSLGLAQALATFPPLPKNKPFLESILQLENLAEQYQAASGQEYPQDLLMSTLLRSSPSEVRRHLQLTVTSRSTYMDVREALLSFERMSQQWDPSKLLQSSSSDNLGLGADPNGLAPMDVDQVNQVKGYGKWQKGGKGKGHQQKGGKGYSSWWSSGFLGKGNYGQKGKDKGKGKKGKKGSKGKSKDKGKNKSKFAQQNQHEGRGRDVCRICGGRGHWGNECPSRSGGSVNQAADYSDVASTAASAASANTRATNFSSAPSYTTANSGHVQQQQQIQQQPQQQRSVIRQVRMFHLGTPPGTIPEEYDIHSFSWFQMEVIPLDMLLANMKSGLFWIQARM